MKLMDIINKHKIPLRINLFHAIAIVNNTFENESGLYYMTDEDLLKADPYELLTFKGLGPTTLLSLAEVISEEKELPENWQAFMYDRRYSNKLSKPRDDSIIDRIKQGDYIYIFNCNEGNISIEKIKIALVFIERKKPEERYVELEKEIIIEGKTYDKLYSEDFLRYKDETKNVRIAKNKSEMKSILLNWL